MDESLYRLASLSRRLWDVPFPLRVDFLGGWVVCLLFVLGAIPIVALGRRSLNGLGPVRKWVAIGLRLAVFLLALLILAGVQWKRDHKDVEVMVLRDTSESTTNVKTFPKPDTALQPALDRYLLGVAEATADSEKEPADRVGVISFQQSPSVDALPNTRLSLSGRGVRDGGTGGTDPAAAIQLGLASLSRDAMHRMLLVWDGNATAGDLDAALSAASAQRVPIDVMPLRYDVRNEVLMDRFIAPTWKREGEPFSLEILLRSTNPADVAGNLSVLDQGVAMDLDPAVPGSQSTRRVTLEPGINRETVRVPGTLSGGVHQFRAVWDGATGVVVGAGGGTGPTIAAAAAAAAPRGDTLAANNIADAFTFVQGRGQILYVTGVQDASAAALLPQALGREDIHVAQTNADGVPHNLVELSQYDAVILANVSRAALGENRQELLARYVHDAGGGLLMIGGEDSLGAGGWQGSELEKVLPVDMDVPAQRQLPQGALVIVVDRSGSMGGDFGGMTKQQAVNQASVLALRALSEQDMVGVVSFDAQAQWLFPLQENRHPDHLAEQLKNIGTGGGTFVFSGLAEAVPALEKCDASAKHILLLTDGQTQPADYAPLLSRMRQRRISLSTVGVGQDADAALLQRLAADGGGRFYSVTKPQTLPQVFITEAMIVRRSLIQESDTGLAVSVLDESDDLVKGVASPQPLFGLVLTTKKNDPKVQMPLAAQTGKEGTLDPVLAHWQAGLGRAAVFTGDAHNKWAARWVGDASFSKFWAQVVRGVARPPMSTDFDVTTTVDSASGKGKVVVEALDKDDRFLNFLSIGGTVIGPDLRPQSVRAVQTAPGRYEAEFAAGTTGQYVVGLSYAGKEGRSGQLRSGAVLNTSPELRDLKSNDARLREVALRTGGRLVEPPFDPSAARLFRREGLYRSASLMPVWDLLIPVLLGLFILDVAVRRIALDRESLAHYGGVLVAFVRSHTTTRRVETRGAVDALAGLRGRDRVATLPPVSQQQQAVSPPPRVDVRPPGAVAPPQPLMTPPAAQQRGVASTPPPTAPPPPPTQAGEHTDSLLAAKRRARDRMADGDEA